MTVNCTTSCILASMPVYNLQKDKNMKILCSVEFITYTCTCTSQVMHHYVHVQTVVCTCRELQSSSYAEHL